ncbi:MAG TPA: hypothetical protein VF095_09315 [Bacillota bacterium]
MTNKLTKKLIIVVSLFLAAFLFSASSVFTSDGERGNLTQESLELDREIEKLLEDIPDLEAPVEENEIRQFMKAPSYKPRAGDILYTPSTQCKKKQKNM